jgi:hypothetical protein
MSRRAYRLLVAVWVGLLPAFAVATGADADGELQALKAEAIAIGRELQDVERATLHPGGSQATLYVAVRASGFLLESFTARVDAAEPQRHEFTTSEALALLRNDGWHPLARLRLEPGTHRLHAQFSGRFHDARAGDPPVTGTVEAVFEKGAKALDLVLPIARNDRPDAGPAAQADSPRPGAGRGVKLLAPERLEIVPGSAAAGGPDDPRYRAALLMKDDHRFLSALIELGELREAAARGDALPAPFWLLLAECYLGFGMDAQAAEVHERLAAGAHDPATLARAQLQLAQFDYQRGRPAQAVARLEALRGRLPAALRTDWRVLLTNALLAQERHADVVALLDDQGLGAATPVLRYNLAVAQIRSGKVAEGHAQLDKVGTMAVTSLEQLVLRDKANLTLGYQHLREQRGRDAREAFLRVRAQGPFSNRALLGLGWAEVAPAQAPQSITDTDAVPAAPDAEGSLGTLLREARRPAIEGVATPSALLPSEQDMLRRALTAWTELVTRDPMDPAVQEGMLAIAWALDRLRAHEQSLTRYLNAIAALEAARTRMQEAMRSIRGSVLVNSLLRRDPDSERGWLWKVRDLPAVPETFFLQSLLAEHRFQEPLKRYRDARMLGSRVEAWRKRLDELEARGAAAPPSLRARLTALRPRFGALAAAQDDALESLSLRELEGQRAAIERYLTEARFAVARIYDRQHALESP